MYNKNMNDIIIKNKIIHIPDFTIRPAEEDFVYTLKFKNKIFNMLSETELDPTYIYTFLGVANANTNTQ